MNRKPRGGAYGHPPPPPYIPYRRYALVISVDGQEFTGRYFMRDQARLAGEELGALRGIKVVGIIDTKKANRKLRRKKK